MMTSTNYDWAGQEWLLEEISLCLGAREMLQRSCNVCRAWRRWCNESVKVLKIGNDSQRSSSAALEGTITSRALEPLFLPLVPLGLVELNLSGTWTALQADELGAIRRGCCLRKLTLTGMRLYSFSYRELLLFEYLEELDISYSYLDVPLPFLLFEEPAGEGNASYAAMDEGTAPISTSTNAAKNYQVGFSNNELTKGGAFGKSHPKALTTTSSSRAQPSLRSRPSLEMSTSTSLSSTDGDWGDAASVLDSPRFTSTLRKLTAVKTGLWKRWDLSRFGPLRTLEVSEAGRSMLEQLARKAQAGSALTGLSVCDVPLRNLVRATELHELAEAVGHTSTFRLRRVDVVKDIPHFAYLRAVLVRLRSLQELELTDVTLDDAMLRALGECLLGRKAEGSVSDSSPPPAPSPPVYGSPTGLSSLRYPPPVPRRQIGASSLRRNHGAGFRGSQWSPTISDKGVIASGRGSCGIAALRTIILGRCEGISSSAFDEFLALLGTEVAGNECEGDGGRRGYPGKVDHIHVPSMTAQPTTGGGKGRVVSSKGSASARNAFGGESGRLSSSMALSTVRLRGCRALEDRALKTLAAGVRGRLKDIQVTGSLRLTDSGIEALATACPRLEHVDVSGCPNLTSITLSTLLAKCPVLRTVKAWGIRAAGTEVGSLVRRARRPGIQSQRMQAVGEGGEILCRGQDSSGPRSPAAIALAVRSAYAAREVELCWTEALPSPYTRVDVAAEVRGARQRGEMAGREQGDDTGVVDAELGDRRPCDFGCGATPKVEDAVDHLEVCPLAPVPCVLIEDGCTWRGTSAQRRLHIKNCPFWQVKCPVCCYTMHSRDFSAHVLAHSLASEASALRPPGCPLRAYGCRACRGGSDLQPTSTAALVGSQEKGHNAALCPFYRIACRSCQQEVGRREWDSGEHSCSIRRRVDVLAKHTSGAGMLRNRQHLLCSTSPPWYFSHSVTIGDKCRWLQVVYGYLGGEGKDGEEDDLRDGAFHGVNPMCAMPQVLSATLPLPGPAGAPASPAATSPG